MNTVEILKNCYKILNEKKSEDIVIMNLSEINSFFDYFIVTTGNSHIHCKSLARDLRNYLLSIGLNEGSKPDYDSGWVILDFNDIIIHIFTEELREYYQLEKLWADSKLVEFEDVR